MTRSRHSLFATDARARRALRRSTLSAWLSALAVCTAIASLAVALSGAR